MSTNKIPGNSCLAAPKFANGLAYVFQGVQESCLNEGTCAFQSKAEAEKALSDMQKLLDGPLRPAIVVFVQRINCDNHITFPCFNKLQQNTVEVPEGNIFFSGTAGVPNVIEYTFTPTGTNDPIKMTVKQTKRPVDTDDGDIKIIDRLRPYVEPWEDSAVNFKSLWYTKANANGTKQELRVCVPQKGNTCASAVWLTSQHQYFPHSSAVMDDTDYNPIKNGGDSLLDIFKKLGISEVLLAGLAPGKDLLHMAADLTMQGFKVSILQSATSCLLPVSSRGRAFGYTLEAHDYAMNSTSPYYRAQFADSLRIRVYPTWRSFTSEYAEQVAFKTPPGGKVRNNTQTADLEFKLYNVFLPIGRSTWTKLRGYAREAKEAYDDEGEEVSEPQGTELEQLFNKEGDSRSSEFVSDKYVVICNGASSPQHVETVGANKVSSRSQRWASVQFAGLEGAFVSAIFCVRPKAFGFVMDSDESTMQLIKEMLEFRDSVAITMLLALLEQIQDKLRTGAPTTTAPTTATAAPTAAPKGRDPTTQMATSPHRGFQVNIVGGNKLPSNFSSTPVSKSGAADNSPPRNSRQQSQAPNATSTPEERSELDVPVLQNLYIALFLVCQEALSRYQKADEDNQPKSQGQCLAELGFGWGSYTKPVGEDGRKSPDLYRNVCAYQRLYWQDNGRAMLGQLYDKLKRSPERLGKLGKDISTADLVSTVGTTFEKPLKAFDSFQAALASEKVDFTAIQAREYICLDDVFVYLHEKKAHEQKHPQCVSRSSSSGVQKEFIAYARSKVRSYAPQGATLSYVTVYPMPRSADELHPGLFHVMAKDVPVDPTQSEQSSEPTRIALMLMPSNSYYDTQHYAKLLPFPVQAVAPFAFMQGGNFVPLHSPGNPCVFVSNQA